MRRGDECIEMTEMAAGSFSAAGERASIMRSFVEGAALSLRPADPRSLQSLHTAVQIVDCRTRARRLCASTHWILLQLFAVMLDGYVLFQLLTAYKTNIYLWLGAVTSWVYLADCSLRCYGLGPTVYFNTLPNIMDTAVVLVTSCQSFLELYAGDSVPHVQRVVLKAARMLRVLRMIGGLRRTLLSCCDCMRYTTGRHKRRFEHPELELDLDLVYITAHMIGMSVPANGWLTRFYRNPLVEVVRFFESFHEDHYLIFNLCPEMPYPASAFPSGRVECFDIQDHTPPLLTDTMKFLTMAEEWFRRNPRNVIAVHCRGGKGRTGSFCCSWLLYAGEVDNWQDALNFFAMRRTDLDRSFGLKVQGVETPSQVRYVEYIDQLLTDQGLAAKGRRQRGESLTKGVDPPAALALPHPRKVRLLAFDAVNLFRGSGENGQAAPEDFPEIVAGVQDRLTRKFVLWSVSSFCGALDLRGAVVCGDVRVAVFGRDWLDKGDLAATRRQEAEGPDGKFRPVGKERGCLFYIIFHTAFLSPTGELRVPMPMVDKACRNPRLYRQDGEVRLTFAFPG